MVHPPMTRRELLRTAGRMAGLAAAAGTGAFVLPRRARAIDWQRVMEVMGMADGYGTVAELDGNAFADEEALRSGDRIESGAAVRCTRGSTLVLHLSDDAMLRLNGPAEMKLEVGGRELGLITLLAGAVLAVLPKDRLYLLTSAATTIGIKGTVLYREQFRPDALTGTRQSGERTTVPRGLRDYVCLCHGELEYLHPETLEVGFTDSAEYHGAWFLNPERPLVRAPAGQIINHTDRHIQDLIDRQPAETRHDASWLREV